MPSPDEIQIKTFPVTLRGFDQMEVTHFLQEVAEQLKNTLERAEALDAGAVLEAAKRTASEASAKAKAEADIIILEAEALKTLAAAEAAALMAKARADADELMATAERTRDDAARIRADARGLSERELKQAALDSEAARLKAADEIELILSRADAEVSSMLRAFRDGRDDLLGIGRHLAPRKLRNPRRGSQRQLGQ